jgi:hypothetical protein
MSLADKIRKAREVKVEVDTFTFTVRRPTDLEMIELQKQTAARAILPFIVDWSGVSELSMFDGGSPHPLPFDQEACATWLEDRLDILSQIVKQAFAAYQNHKAKIEQLTKN